MSLVYSEMYWSQAFPIKKKKKLKKDHNLMHSTGLIETYSNLKEVNRACRELNDRYGLKEYWVVSVKKKKLLTKTKK